MISNTARIYGQFQVARITHLCMTVRESERLRLSLSNEERAVVERGNSEIRSRKSEGGGRGKCASRDRKRERDEDFEAFSALSAVVSYLAHSLLGFQNPHFRENGDVAALSLDSSSSFVRGGR